MFTGIIEEIGTVTATNRVRTGISLKIKAEKICSDIKSGDSVAINGVCLTVTDIKASILNCDVMQETLSRTTLGELKPGDSLNLERALRLDSRLGGHFITGHVDYKARIEDMIRTSTNSGFKISLPEDFLNLVVEKGSIALDGVSLTVAVLSKTSFTVYLIPHTLKNTTFAKKKKGDLVNVEMDLLAKYTAKQKDNKIDLKTMLERYEYI